MAAHQQEFRVTAMCRVLAVPRSGFYAWLARPQSNRERDDQRVEDCGKHRVYRLMRSEGLRAQVGYGRRPQAAGTRKSAAGGCAEPAESTIRCRLPEHP